MNKIVFLKFTPLTQKVYTDCCMEALLSNGYLIEYWEISKLVDAHYTNFERFDPANNLELKDVENYNEFRRLVSQNEKTLFITLMSLKLKHIKFLKILSKQNCKLAFWGPFPTPYERRTTVDRLKRISLKGIRAKINQEIIKFCFKIKYVHLIDYMFAAGRKGCLELCLGFHIKDFMKNIQLFPINSSDYNNYKYKTQNRVVDYDYIVFLDEYYPFHPDDDLWGTRRYPNDIYYASLNRTLDIIEKHYGLKVVVAAHPKALLYKEHNYFNGRTVLFNATGSLVKFARMAITHDSTSMSFAVMNKIPILQLTSDWLEHNRQDLIHSIQSFSNRLALPVLNMDKVKDSDLVDISLGLTQEQSDLFDVFIYDYCTTPGLDKSNDQLILAYSNQIFNK